MAKGQFNPKHKNMVCNPLEYQHHYMSIEDWIKQCFEIQCDSSGRPIILPSKPIIDENGNEKKQVKYKIKRKAEEWMIAVAYIMELEKYFREKDFDAKKKQMEEFAFYGSYDRIRNKILSCVDSRLVPQLSRTITRRSISTSMKRAEASGFIKISYDHTVTRNTCSVDSNYRRITLNYAKLQELSEFNLTNERSQTWKNYHRCSREHKWLRKRPVSYLKPLIDELADKKRKEEFREQLKALKLKLKNHQDVFKAFIIRKQKMYQTKKLDNLTAIKSTKDEMSVTYQKPVGVESESPLTPEQEAILHDFYLKLRV